MAAHEYFSDTETMPNVALLALKDFMLFIDKNMDFEGQLCLCMSPKGLRFLEDNISRNVYILRLSSKESKVEISAKEPEADEIIDWVFLINDTKTSPEIIYGHDLNEAEFFQLIDSNMEIGAIDVSRTLN